jgi:CBS domain-containing protein
MPDGRPGGAAAVRKTTEDRLMKIADVLAAKPRGVVTLWTHHTLADAIHLFDERNISSVVIVDPDRRPLGLVTDRDAVRVLALRGGDALAARVVDVMQSPPPLCTPEWSVSQAMSRMTLDRVRHLVVMAEGEMLGVVSIGDLVKVRLDDADVESRVLRDLAFRRLAGE